jgi:hypothetical protein
VLPLLGLPLMVLSLAVLSLAVLLGPVRCLAADTGLRPAFEMNFHFISQAAVDNNPAAIAEPALKLEVATLDLGITYPRVLGWKRYKGQRQPARILHNRFIFRKENIEAESRQDLGTLGLSDVPGRPLSFQTENFFRLGWQGVYVERFTHAWSLNGIGGFLLSANEIDRAGLGDLAWQAGLLLDHQTASGWTVGLGLMYNQLTGEDSFLPLVHLKKSTRSGALRLALRVPRAEVWYRPGSGGVEYGFIAQLDGSQYRLPQLQAVLFDRQGRVLDAKTDVSLAYSVFSFGPALKLAEVDGLAAFVQLGYATARRYEFRSPDSDRTLVLPPDALVGAGEKLVFDLGASLFVRANLHYRFGQAGP